MTLTTLAESVLLSGIALLLLTTISLGAGLLVVRMFRKRVENGTRTGFLRLLLCATYAGIVITFLPLPRPQIIPPIPILSAMPPKPAILPPSNPLLVPGALPTVRPTPSPLDFTPIPDSKAVSATAIVIAAGWLLGTTVLLARLAMGYVYARRLLKRSPAISPFSTTGAIYLAPFASARRCPAKIITVASADLFMVDLPFLPSFLALPGDADTRFEPSALRAILFHERGHLERYDGWWNLSGQALCCLLWFQPLVWILLRTMERNSEAACDEVALAHSECTARDYAETLLRFAEAPRREKYPLTQSLRGVTWLLSPPFLEERIRNLLNRASLPELPRIPRPLQIAVALSLIVPPPVSAFLFGIRDIDEPVKITTPSSNLTGYPDVVTEVSIPLPDNEAMKQLRKMRESLRQVMKRSAAAEEVSRRNAVGTYLPPPTDYEALGNLSFSVGGQRYRTEATGHTIRMTVTPMADNGLPRTRITGRFKSGTLRGVLEEMLQGTGLSVQAPLDLELGKSFTLENAPISEAIPALLNLYPERLYWKVVGSQLRVQRRAELIKVSRETEKKWDQFLARTMSVDWINTPIRPLIEQLFVIGGIENYSIDDSVTGTATVRAKGKPLRSILTDVLRQADIPARFAFIDGVVTIFPRRP